MTAGWGGRKATALRAELERALPLPCVRCGAPVHPEQAWDVDHIEARIDGGAVWNRANLGPAHARCNRSAGGRSAHRRRRMTQGIRPWPPPRPDL